MENDFFVQSNKLYIRPFYLAHYSWFMISKLALIIYPTKAVAKDYGFFPILLDECQCFPISIRRFTVSFRFKFARNVKWAKHHPDRCGWNASIWNLKNNLFTGVMGKFENFLLCGKFLVAFKGKPPLQCYFVTKWSD